MDSLIFDAKSMRTKDENGFLHVKMTPISKETVNPYYGREIIGYEELGLDPDKIYYLYRSGEELKKGASTFNGLPLLMNHHMESAENPQKEFRVGSTGTDAVFNAPYLENSLSVTDDVAIQNIENGSMKEISCAYRYTPVMKAGEYKGVAYDGIMTNIRGNHVALVEEGRAGHDVAVADSKPKNMESEVKEQMATEEKGVVKDASKAIEGAENYFANMLKALNVVEAQIEGIEPEDGFSSNSSVDDIVAKLFANAEPETKESVKRILEKIKGSALKGDKKAEDCGSKDCGVVEKKEEDVEEDCGGKDCNKKAEDCGKAKDCGDLAAGKVSPKEQQAFAEGVKYGEEKEKAEPKKLDSEHEAEGMEKKVEAAHDANTIKAEAIKEVTEKFKAMNSAAKEVASIIGNIDPFAFDSAEAIYGKALEVAGIDISKYEPASYKGMIDVMNATRKDVIVGDCVFNRPKEEPKMDGVLEGLKRISIMK